MNWRFWRWFRTDDLATSQNIEDRRADKPRTYWQTMMDWWYGPKEEMPAAEPPAKLARDLGIEDIGNDYSKRTR